MTNIERLKEAFRRHGARCIELGSGSIALKSDMRSLAYSFILDEINGNSGFSIQEIVTACEAVLAEMENEGGDHYELRGSASRTNTRIAKTPR